MSESHISTNTDSVGLKYKELQYMVLEIRINTIKEVLNNIMLFKTSPENTPLEGRTLHYKM